MMKKEVLNFIRGFINGYDEFCDRFFTMQNCYYFAVILQHRFSEGVIMYDRSCQHFVCKIEDKLYDIEGEVTDFYSDDDLVEWSEFENIDSVEQDSIYRTCVLLK